MQLTQTAWIKPAVWGAVTGSVLTMILGFGWGGWTLRSTANTAAMARADAAVTAALVPLCLAREKRDGANAQKRDQLKGMTSSWDQTAFVMKTGWATFPGNEEPNRDVAEACAAALLKTADTK
jgi:hypothetical protein